MVALYLGRMRVTRVVRGVFPETVRLELLLVSELQQVAVLMASESLCSAVPQYQCNLLGLNQLSVQDAGSNIELLKSRMADLERKFGQLMAELEILQRTIGQINQQIESLENEILLQVGWAIHIYKALLSMTG